MLGNGGRLGKGGMLGNPMEGKAKVGNGGKLHLLLMIWSPFLFLFPSPYLLAYRSLKLR